MSQQYWQEQIEYKERPEPKPFPDLHLNDFRNWLFKEVEAQQLDTDEIVKSRRFWQEKLEMTPSYVRIYKRHVPEGMDIINRHVIVTKNEDLGDIGLCKNFKDLITPPTGKLSDGIWMMNTDALFHYWDSQGGEVLAAASREIERDRIRNVWIVRGYKTASFTHAFLLLRKLMGPERMLGDVDIGVYDEHF